MKNEDFLNVEYAGDILYEVRTFRYRYEGKEAATITILDIVDEPNAILTYEIHSAVPSEYRKFPLAYDIQESLGYGHEATFKSVAEALQRATNNLDATFKLLEKDSADRPKLHDLNDYLKK